MDESEIRKWKKVSLEMARRVERAISPLIGTEEAGKIVKMGADGTPTKLIDLIAEDEVINVLKEVGEPVGLVTEESGSFDINKKVVSRNKKITFVVDPLDGTTNAIKNIPFYGISIAVAEHPQNRDPVLNDVVIGVVRNFTTRDTYTAIKDGGASLNGNEISPSSNKFLNEASVGAFIYGTRFKDLDNLCSKIRRMRILGAVALELSYVANGVYDAFIDIRGRLRIVDIAAAKLIVDEAGGIVTDHQGNVINGPLNVRERTSLVAAGNNALHSKIIEVLEEL